MRREQLYLQDICAAADAVKDFITGLDEAGFRNSDLLRSAVVHKLAVAGEAASRIPGEIKTKRSEVPWAEIVAFRNILVHAYFGIDWGVVRHAATVQLPVLRAQVAAILGQDFDRPEA